VLSESDWIAWSDPAPLLRLFAGQERKLGLLAEAARRVGLGPLLEPSDQVAPLERRRRLCDLIRDLFGYPCRRFDFSPTWLSGHRDTVVRMARAIYEEDRFTDLPVLADALEEAGCTNLHILNHCRGPGPHAKGCWVVDALRGGE
jgi:hypothetical protein